MALFITNPTNIRYLTGFVGVDKRDAYLLILGNKKILFTIDLYREQAKQLSNIQIIQSTKYPIEIKKMGIKTLEFEEADLTVSEYNRLAKLFTLIPTKNRIEKLRQIKRADEIANIRRAASVTDACFEIILGKLKPGVSESEIAWEIESFFKKQGAERAFSPIVAFGKNSSQPHYGLLQGVPLQSTEHVLLDSGAKVNGYCADMTRVVFLGPPKSEWVKTYETVLTANKEALDMLKNGERNGGVLDEKTKPPNCPHSLGHAVGLDIHESPRLTIKKPAMLKAGMVVTIEPGIYIEGAYGIRIEDLVLLKEKGIEILSKSKKDLVVL